MADKPVLFVHRPDPGIVGLVRGPPEGARSGRRGLFSPEVVARYQRENDAGQADYGLRL